MRAAIATLFIVLLLALMCGLIMRWATASGIGMTTDSLRYLNVSRSLLRGDGFVITREKSNKPMTHFAPLYPVAIAGVSKATGVSPDLAVRWLQVALMAGNVLLIALLGYRATNGSPVLTVIVAFTATFAAALVQVHRYALSEGLFLFNQSAALFCIALYLARRHRGWLVAAAVFATAALLTRYAGAALIGACILSLLWPGELPFRRRVLDAFIFALTTLFLPAIWITRNLLTAETAVNRKIEFHLLNAKHIDDALTTIGTWVVPPGLPVSMTLLAVGAIGTLIILALLRHRPTTSAEPIDSFRGSTTIRALTIYALTYIAMLVVSISFIDYYTPLDFRILAPLYPVFLIVVAWVIHRTLPAETMHVRRAIVVIAIGLLSGQIVRGATVYNEMHQESAGFTSKRWDDSRLIERLEQFPEDTPVYSNAPDVITLATGRRALGLPAIYDATTGVPHESFAEEIQAFRTRFRGDSNAVLVYFRRVKRPFLPSEGYLRKRIVLRSIYDGAEGAIYKRAALKPAPAAAAQTQE